MSKFLEGEPLRLILWGTALITLVVVVLITAFTDLELDVVLTALGTIVALLFGAELVRQRVSPVDEE